MSAVQTARYSKLPLYWHISLPPMIFSKSTDVLGSSPAGPLNLEEQGDLGKLVMDLSPIGIPTTSATFAVRAVGDSMTGAGIHSGDIVILEKRSVMAGDIVVALLENEVTLKRYVIENGKHLLRPENSHYEDIPLIDQSQVQGVAVGLIRKL